MIVSAPDGAVLELLKTSTTTTVICDITPFGRGTDWRDWQGGELIYQALSGVMFENGTTGLPPLYGVGHRASYAAGAIGYLQCLALLLSDRWSRHLVDLSIAEVASSMNFNRATQYQLNRVIEVATNATIRAR